ncbi:MAG: autotransporter outer membrane beta-barrel domain-containing protein [Woeseiaceae bacterium]|nr:autotransporter outer membrane beta-barrel domain-containing protein [Woeseiaceae bacterium]
MSAFVVFCASQAFAQSAGQGPGLTGLTFANQVETEAAAANQAAFEVLNEACNSDGRFDQTPVPQFADAPAGSGCTPEAFSIFRVTRELVHTANDLQGSGPFISSLGHDLEGLGLALRWTAAEEFAAQSSMATDFANNQLSNLAARLSALRFGARGISFAALPVNPEGDTRVAGLERPRGGAASGDDTGESYSPWGGFINGAFGWGKKEPTDLEDPFDFDGAEYTAGIDYRFDNNFILGGIAGYTEQTVDFDESADDIIVTDGMIEADGYSLLLFGLFEGDHLTFSASAGYQALDYEAERNIYYPSFNPNIESVIGTAKSRPESTVVMGTISLGYAMQLGRLTIEPFVSAEYVDITIDQFTEDRTTNPADPNEVRNWSLLISKQSIESLDAAFGINIHLVLTPSFAVLVPYVGVEFHNESEDLSRDIAARYVGLEVLNPNGFNVPTDPADSSYTQSSAGLSIVFRGGRPRDGSGAIYGRLQGFVQYTRIDGLDFYENEVVSGGIRYAF